jgi:hypothetical protein
VARVRSVGRKQLRTDPGAARELVLVIGEVFKGLGIVAILNAHVPKDPFRGLPETGNQLGG